MCCCLVCTVLYTIDRDVAYVCVVYYVHIRFSWVRKRKREAEEEEMDISRYYYTNTDIILVTVRLSIYILHFPFVL